MSPKCTSLGESQVHGNVLRWGSGDDPMKSVFETKFFSNDKAEHDKLESSSGAPRQTKNVFSYHVGLGLVGG